MAFSVQAFSVHTYGFGNIDDIVARGLVMLQTMFRSWRSLNFVGTDFPSSMPWYRFSWRSFWMAWNLMNFHGDSRFTPDAASILVDSTLVHPGALVTTIPGAPQPTLEILSPRLDRNRITTTRSGSAPYIVYRDHMRFSVKLVVFA